MKDVRHKVMKRHGSSISSEQSLCDLLMLDRRRIAWRVSDYVSQSWEVRNYHKAQARNTLHSLYALYDLLVTACN